MHFIDSHAHINDEAFNEDRENVVKKSFAAAVSKIIEIACRPREWLPALALCAKYEGKFFAAAGVHPIYAKDFNKENLEELKRTLLNEKIRAVGEIGLDYAWEEISPKALQAKVFEQMLELACISGKPIIIHCRKVNAPGDYAVYDDLFAILKNFKFNGGIFHCFGGRYQDAKKASDMGFKLGINGTIGYKKNDDLRETVAKIGLKRITLETDCPYLPPQTKRGKRNDPSNIPEIALNLAGVLGLPLEEIAKITTENTENLFGV
jgi:TatD DNase family protein